MDPQLFAKYNKFADDFKTANKNLYFFLKDCGFQRIFRGNGQRFPDQMTQNMCNAFQSEMQQAGWTRNQMQKETYKKELESIFSRLNFNTVDLQTCELMKVLTENLGIFGAFDDLTNKRIIYFNKKIDALRNSQPKPVNSNLNLQQQNSGGLSNNYNNNTYNQNSNNNLNNITNNNTNNNNLGLPSTQEGNKEAMKQAQEAEDARLNEMMRLQKLNSPVYITNMQPGTFYNPFTCPNYIPQGIDRSFQLPMSKNHPDYQKYKNMINEELILANQELDYHKIDMARNHLEKAAYYLKNIVN